MANLAFITLLNREDSKLSPHFGKAKWVAIRDEQGAFTFEQNTGLNGRAVVDILKRHACADVLLSEIGPGAFQHLQAAGIQAWLAPTGVPATQLYAQFLRGELPRVTAPTHDHGQGQHHGGGHDTVSIGRGDGHGHP